MDGTSRVTKVSDASLGSVAALCKVMVWKLAEFDELLAWDPDLRFKRKKIPKADGGQREVFVPHWRLRIFLRRLNKRLLANPDVIQWPNYLFGSIPSKGVMDAGPLGTDYVACASRHCGARSVLKIDVANFFGSISVNQVSDIFRSFLKYPKRLSDAIASLCCADGYLAQGAPTSSYLANLVFWSREHRVVARLKRKGLIYTRYVDDITVSSKRHDQDFSLALSLVDSMLTAADLTRSTAKTRVLRSGADAILVHGLRVEYPRPRIPKEEVGRVRSAVAAIENFATEPNFRLKRKYRKMFNRCLGRVNKLSRVQDPRHPKLLKRLRRIEPLPHPSELGNCRRWSLRLASSFPTRGDRFFFKKSCFRLRERLNLLAKSYPDEARKIRSQVAMVANSYEK